MVFVQPAHFAEAGVLGHDAVALAEDEIIAAGTTRLGAETEVIAVENGQNFHERKRAGDVNGRSVVGHAQNRPPQIGGSKAGERGRHKFRNYMVSSTVEIKSRGDGHAFIGFIVLLAESPSTRSGESVRTRDCPCAPPRRKRSCFWFCWFSPSPWFTPGKSSSSIGTSGTAPRAQPCRRWWTGSMRRRTAFRLNTARSARLIPRSCWPWPGANHLTSRACTIPTWRRMRKTTRSYRSINSRRRPASSRRITCRRCGGCATTGGISGRCLPHLMMWRYFGTRSSFARRGSTRSVRRGPSPNSSSSTKN